MSYQEQLHPWVVYRLLPNCQRVMVDRFRKRNDAEEYCKAVKRLSPHAQFEIVFEANTTPDEAMNWHGEVLTWTQEVLN
jgi:hypothetical protein